MAAGDVTANISKVSGKAIYFDGTAKIDCGIGSTINLTDKISIALWFKMDAGSANDQKIINKGTDNDKEYNIVFENGQPEAVFRYTSGELKCVYASDKRDGLWHHYVLTGEANGNLKLYVDGILRDTKTVTDSTIPNDSTKKLYIGCRDGWIQYWEGKLDNIRIWNKILTQAEITKDYNTQTISSKKLVAHYPFENSTNRYRDESGNSNNGTAINTIVSGGHNTTEDDIESVRVNANSKYGFIPLSNNQEIMTVHIEEA